MNMNDVIINLQQQIFYIDRLNIYPTNKETRRQRQVRRSSLVIAIDIIGSIQDFGEMVEKHADENWTGEEIIQALVHRDLYHTERGTDEA